MKQRLRNTVRISHFLQIEDETASGVAANKIVFHVLGLLVERMLATSVDTCQ
jgi:hypothetical protein